MWWYPDPPSHSILLSVVCENEAYATVPGDLKRQFFWPAGKRFWRIVREVLNLTEAVVKVDSVAALTFP